MQDLTEIIKKLPLSLQETKESPDSSGQCTKTVKSV